MSGRCGGGGEGVMGSPPARRGAAPALPSDEGTCEMIRYIDESGSSSCASSLVGEGEPNFMDDTASLSHLLDDVGPGQFSIDALDDLASMSCGYASLDTKSDMGSETKFLSPVSKRNKKFLKSVNALSDGDEKSNKSLERHRKMLKPCGEMLMRRSLGSEEVLKAPNLRKNIPSVSLPGSTKVSPRSKLSNDIRDDAISKCSSHQSYHTSQSSIKSSDNMMDDVEPIKIHFLPLLRSSDGGFRCSSPLMPPQCTPPPIPQGESSYVTSTSNSSIESSSSSFKKKNALNKKRINDNKKSSNHSDNQNSSKVILDPSSSCSSSGRDINSSNDINVKDRVGLFKDSIPIDSKIEKENAINATRNLEVPLADIDEFSEGKNDHTYDTLESKSDDRQSEKSKLETDESYLDEDIASDEEDSKSSPLTKIDDDCDFKTRENNSDESDCETFTEEENVAKRACEPDEGPDSDEISKQIYDIKYGEIEDPDATDNEVATDFENGNAENTLTAAAVTEEGEDTKCELEIKVETEMLDGRPYEDESHIKFADETKGVDTLALEDKSRLHIEIKGEITEEENVHSKGQEFDESLEEEYCVTPLTPNSKINFSQEAWSPGLEPPLNPLHTSTPHAHKSTPQTSTPISKTPQSLPETQVSQASTPVPHTPTKGSETSTPLPQTPISKTSTAVPEAPVSQTSISETSILMTQPRTTATQSPQIILPSSLFQAKTANHSSSSSPSSTSSRGGSGGSCRVAPPPPYLVIPNVSGTPNSRLTPPPFLNLPSHPGTPTTPTSPFPLAPNTPNSMISIPDSLGSTPSNLCNPTAPHHYISSLRVASMRGTADMGGALVARVAAFLRTQYKSFASCPMKLPWCPKFSMCVSEFSCNVTPMPLPGHPTTSGVAIPCHSVLRNTQQVGGMESRPGRVLVESGRCSYARTALPFSLAYHWATNALEHQLNHYSIVFVLTVRDFKGGSLFQHLCKEVLPKHILSKEAMNTLWNYLHKIDDKLLFLLVGWDEMNEGEGPGDLLDLVEGRLLPGSTVLITSAVDSNVALNADALNRVYRVTGLDLEGTQAMLSGYCAKMSKPDFSEKVIALVRADLDKFGYLAECPITTVVLAVIYEDMGGKLPSRLTDLYSALLKHMTRINLLRRGEPMCYDVLPDKYVKLFQEFGKLSLETIKNRSPYLSLQDIKTKCQNGQELLDMGLLLKLQSASKHTKKEHYTPIHSCMLEFMAAYYLSGLITSETQLQTELDALAMKIDITKANNTSYGGVSGVRVVQCLVGLLGRNAYLVMNMLAQMAPHYPPTAMLLLRLLRESGRGQMNVIEVCKHVSNRDHVIIQSHSSDLDDWGRLLYSPDCTLETLEILLDLDADTRWMADRQDAFFTSLAFNESARNIKLTCVLGGNFGDAEVTRLVSYVRSVLTKRRLEGFELQVTSVLDFDTSDLNKEDQSLGIKSDDKDFKEGYAKLNESSEQNKEFSEKELPDSKDCDNSSLTSDKAVDNNIDNNDDNISTDRSENEKNEHISNISRETNEDEEADIHETKTLERSQSCTSRRRSVYDSANDDVEAGISELEHTVCELISKVGNSIGNGLIEEETEDDIANENRGKSDFGIEEKTTTLESTGETVTHNDDDEANGNVVANCGSVTNSNGRSEVSNGDIVRSDSENVKFGGIDVANDAGNIGLGNNVGNTNVKSDVDDFTKSSTRRTVEVLSPVVEMICDTLPDLTPSLTRLVLALELDSDQVERVCSVVGPGVQTLHLPRLACGRRGLRALSKLMGAGTIKAVNLAGSISTGTPIDDKITAPVGITPSPTTPDETSFTCNNKTKKIHFASEENDSSMSSSNRNINRHSTSTEESDSSSRQSASQTDKLSTDLTALPSTDASATLPKLSKNKLRPPHMRSTANGDVHQRPPRSRPPSTLYTPSPSLLAFWSFTDAEGNRRSVFNSLPRSFYQSLPRRARHNGCIGGDKRNADVSSIMLQKTSFPPPICCPSLHDNGFHEVLQVLRSPCCRVCQMDLSKCTLGAEDLVCLGETVRYTTCLTSLHMEGLSRMAEIIPVLIGLQSSTSLQLLDLSSPHLLLGDAALQVSLAALGRCIPLRFLVISGWTLQLENARSLEAFTHFLTQTQVQQMELAGARISLTVPDGPLARLGRQDDLTAVLTEVVPALSNDSIAFLNLDNVEINVNGNITIRGPHLLHLVRHMPRLLDLSLACHTAPHQTNATTLHHSGLLPTTNTIGASSLSSTLNSPLSDTLLKHHSPHITGAGAALSSHLHHDLLGAQSPSLQDSHTKALFAMLSSAFPSLKRINMSGWSFSLDNCNKVMLACGRALKTSGLREVVAGGVTVRGLKGVGPGGEAEHLLLSMLTSHLHHLAHLSIIGVNMNPVQAAAFGKSIRDKMSSSSLLLDTRGLQYLSMLALRQAVVEGTRHEMVFLGGPAATYHVRKIERKENLLGKWACISTTDR